MKITPTTTPANIKKLIENIQQEEQMTPKRAKELVLEARIKVEDLKEYADFEHDPTEGYGRKMVFCSDTFEVMVMSWMPGDFSAIHNHGYTQWGAVQVFGKAQHNIYTYKKPQLSIAKQETLLSGEIVKVNHTLIHQMGNAGTNPYLSLHIYGCEAGHEAITADSSIYELEKNRIVKTTGGAFFELPDAEVAILENELKAANDATFQYHSQLLFQFYERFPNAKLLKNRLLEKIQQFKGLN